MSLLTRLIGTMPEVGLIVVVDFAGEYSVGQKSEDFRYWHQCDNYDIFDNLLDFFIQFLRLA